MPILGDRNSEPIREKMIREILNEDQNIYRQVFEKEKEQASKYIQILTPQQANLSYEMQTKLDNDVNVFLLELEKIYKDLSKARTKIQLISVNVLPTVIEYNKIMSQLNNPALSVITRNHLASTIQKTIPYLEAVKDAFIKVIQENDLNKSPSVKSPSESDEIVRLIYGYTVILLMINNIKNNIYTPLDQSTIRSNFESTVRINFGGTPLFSLLMNLTKPSGDNLNQLLMQRIKADEDF